MTNSEDQKVDKDYIVSMHYTLTLDDGETVDSSVGKEPLEYLHGHANIVPGLESQLQDAAVGGKVTAVVNPAEGYGEHHEDGVQEVPLDQLPAELEEGMQLQAHAENGQPMVMMVKEIKENSAVIDMNHPLAGKTLHFDVEVLAVRKATEKELEHGHAHGPDDCGE